ncbi:glycerophosphoryl diester phosphodiesterase [Metabacillus crassostreae]|uniref:glycerophosphodiester phosphodiesterase n=1 Tax=Metabacillus crassostreae TaxID=929098 RepID=UPI00195BCBAE|nr:glycerophosphodiester phosphodiesterase [Metabacillus crassostreae]MBM7604575.1 glycerophosphoryl diester phosphodiesterase [Metabacillus crassostreae]
MTLIFGHRGAAGSFPENTMLSFDEAIQAGAHGIELDVQMTKDGVIVVIHDETVDRTTNGKGFIKDLDYKEITMLDASHSFLQFSGKVRIPTLEEVLEWSVANPSILVNIELKNGIVEYPELEEKTIKLVTKYKLEDKVILSSFNHYSLVKCRSISDEIKTAILFMEGLYKPWEYAQNIGAQGLHPYFYAAKSSLIKEAQSFGIDVRPFTVNDPSVMRQMFSDQVAAIITDYPERALKLYNEYKKE